MKAVRSVAKSRLALRASISVWQITGMQASNKLAILVQKQIGT